MMLTAMKDFVQFRPEPHPDLVQLCCPARCFRDAGFREHWRDRDGRARAVVHRLNYDEFDERVNERVNEHCGEPEGVKARELR